MANVFLSPLLWLVNTVADLYIMIIIVAVIASWLVAFGILNLRNPLARQLFQILDALTEPVFRQVRRVIPPIRGLDLSPIIVWICIELLRIFLDNLLVYLMYPH
ncbi:MAG: YggT family protein [Rhizomicrobium sp.]